MIWLRAGYIYLCKYLYTVWILSPLLTYLWHLWYAIVLVIRKRRINTLHGNANVIDIVRGRKGQPSLHAMLLVVGWRRRGRKWRCTLILNMFGFSFTRRWQGVSLLPFFHLHLHWFTITCVWISNYKLLHNYVLHTFTAYVLHRYCIRGA